jgi:threonine synthase
MNINEFPDDIRENIIPNPSGSMFYRCLACNREFDIENLLYTCPSCGGILMLYQRASEKIETIDGDAWRKIFDYRRMINLSSLRGIFRFYEFIAPIIPLESIVYLGEGSTPLVEANIAMEQKVGLPFYFKYEGLNPSLSFKDRGMACALSFLNYLTAKKGLKNILAICASTGDTSASAALYSAYLTGLVKSAVILPKGKVTSQQLSQPIVSGATVFEIPGVFDDCMKVVEELSEKYNVALLNSKNSWRILGQESFAFEVAQDFDYNVRDKVIVVPIGNAGNISAIMSGFLKFFKANIISGLPKILGVQSEHANPVYRYYLEEDTSMRVFKPVHVKPSVAQAAMIGNPVSMPRVIDIVREYNQIAGQKRVFVAQVTEQEIMDATMAANKNGHIVCTQGGESLAGLMRAREMGISSDKETGILDSTAHSLKFSGFQQMYLEDSFPEEFGVKPNKEYRNSPVSIIPEGIKKMPGTGEPLTEKDLQVFVRASAETIANILSLKKI